MGVLDLGITCVDVLVKFLSSKYYREKFLLYLSIVVFSCCSRPGTVQYMTDKPSKRSTAPNPVSDAAHWRTTGK